MNLIGKSWKLIPKIKLLTSIFEKLHIDEKYFGRKVAPAKLDCLFLFFSSNEKICIVPWSLATHNKVEAALKLIQYIVAGLVPLRSSHRRLPLETSNTRINVPLILAVANLVPKINMKKWAGGVASE